MKKILIIIFSIVLFSCDDVLIEEPKSVSVETFYKTTDELDAGVMAIYSAIRQYIVDRYPAILCSMVDYAQGRAGHAPLSEFQGLDATNANRVYILWDNFYVGIRNANIVIKNAPLAEEVNHNDVSKFVGEAKFMRAFIYFVMVRNWGRLPLRTEENMTELDVPRSSIEDVYQLIIEDLLFAEQNLSDNPSLAGRASKWAAKTILADVYFYLGRYAEARDKALEVFNSNKYALVEVYEPDDFEKIFGAKVLTSSEEIFYIKNTNKSSQGFTFAKWIAHPSSGYQGGGGNFIIYSDKVNNPVIRDWDKENDLRYIYGWHDWNFGFGPTTILSRKYRDPDAPSGNSGAANDFPFYRYADLLLLYAEASSHVSPQPTQEAMDKLNMVHRRAYGKNPVLSSSIDFKLEDYDKESFLSLVLKERGYETQMEAKRWLDLKRSGKVKEIIKMATGKDVAEKALLWPIPPNEMENNKAILPDDQNPGY